MDPGEIPSRASATCASNGLITGRGKWLGDGAGRVGGVPVGGIAGTVVAGLGAGLGVGVTGGSGSSVAGGWVMVGWGGGKMVLKTGCPGTMVLGGGASLVCSDWCECFGQQNHTATASSTSRNSHKNPPGPFRRRRGNWYLDFERRATAELSQNPRRIPSRNPALIHASAFHRTQRQFGPPAGRAGPARRQTHSLAQSPTRFG